MGTKFENLLKEKRAEILEKWENVILGGYAKDSFILFKRQKDQIANPIGHKIRSGLAELYDVLCDPSDDEVSTPDLEELIKLRAVQKISAYEAVSFIFKLKELVRARMDKRMVNESYKEWLAFDARIDAAALAIFNMFMVNRERVYQVRMREYEKGRHILTDGSVCPSALVRQNRNQQETDCKSCDSSEERKSAG